MLLIFLIFENPKVISTSEQIIVYSPHITWTVTILVVLWVMFWLIENFRQVRSKRRPPRQKSKGSLKQIIRAKDELSAIWLRKGASKKIHAIGIGKLANGEYCLQVFVNDSNSPNFENSPNDSVANTYKDFPIAVVAMPQASFLSIEANFSNEDYRSLIRDKQDVIMGGISGANTNLDGECGTIGYFCRKKSVIPRKEIYLLSNSHVFADLRKASVDEHDFILQPSPGESANSRPIAELTHFAHPKLENDTNQANFVDAAIAKLWKQEVHQPLVPMIGKVVGFVENIDVEIGESCRKFGRTTGFTIGSVFSIYLDIWVKYDRTGQSSFFKNQFLIEPNKQVNEKYVEKGDSGSLVVDGENYASGLIFAGANGKVELKENADDKSMKVEKIVTNYGVANPISEVMKKLNIELL